MQLFSSTFLALLLSMVFALPAQAFFWEYSGDTSGTVATSVIVGASSVGAGEYDHQAVQISGLGTYIAAGYSNYRLQFHIDGYTWDSYNPDLGDDHTGYLDVFAAVMNESDYYWNFSNTGSGPYNNIHPINTNPSLVLGVDPFYGTPDHSKDSFAGGTSFDDGILESVSGDVTLDFKLDSTKSYYLSLFLQTTEDEDFPSWGTISDANLTVTPEPASLVLFGTGSLVFGLWRKRSLGQA